MDRSPRALGEPAPGEAAPGEAAPGEPAPSEAPRATGRIRRVFSGSRDLLRIVYRDPEHAAERLTLFARDRLSEPARAWAESVRENRPEAALAEIAEDLRLRSAHIARIDGAVSGTPFLIALVPGYLTFLWQEMRMTMCIAALYGRDPAEMNTAAEMLALRGVHPDLAAARAALDAVSEAGTPERTARRRSLRTWVRSVYLVLVFGGFMSPSDGRQERGAVEWAKTAAGVALGVAIWVTTWVLPVTFMIAMAWGCETHARQLGRRAVLFYDGEEATLAGAIAAADRRSDRGHDRRALLRSGLLFLSVAIPLGFVAYVDHVRNTVGINWLGGLGALVALSLVMATLVLANRH